jgi:hypothetical protein
VYVLTPIEDESQLLEALTITRALRSVKDLKAPLPERPDEIRSPHFIRAWDVLQVLRGMIGRLCHDDRNPMQLHVAHLRYAVHTLSFPESSPRQKQWALAASCSLADQIISGITSEFTLRIDWVKPDLVAPGRLGLTLCPGHRDRGRDLDLDLDLATLSAAGADRLVCMATDSELDWAGVPDLGRKARAAGLTYLPLPVPDQGTPEIADAIALVRWCSDAIQQGQSVILTCMGGLGRSGTIAACTLVSAGLPPIDAISAIRAARGPRAIENADQETFVTTFATSARKVAQRPPVDHRSNSA